MNLFSLETIDPSNPIEFVDECSVDFRDEWRQNLHKKMLEKQAEINQQNSLLQEENQAEINQQNGLPQEENLAEINQQNGQPQPSSSSSSTNEKSNQRKRKVDI